jgi:hypothetical protein
MLSRSIRLASRALWPLLVLGTLPACGGNEDADAVLDAVVEVADLAFRTVEEDETWLAPAAEGSDISGSLTNSIGGSLTAGGWRNSTQHENSGGVHLTFGERMVIELNQWEAAGILLSGRLSLTRHSLDYGPPGGNIEDASRTTRYLGQVDGEGEASGSFAVDVHAFASGSTLWTCGTINDVEIEFGRCY